MIDVWNGTDHKYQDLNDELNIPVPTFKAGHLILTMPVILLEILEPLVLVSLPNAEEDHTYDIEDHNQDLPVLSTDFVETVEQ